MKKFIEIYPVNAPTIVVRQINVTGRTDRHLEKLKRTIFINTDLSVYDFRIVDRPIVKKEVNKKFIRK